MNKREIVLLCLTFVISFLLFYHFRNPFIGQWDSFDYTWQIVKHRPSELFLGRYYYLGYNILIWEAAKRVFNLSSANAHLVIQLTTILLASLTVCIHYFFVKMLVNKHVAFISMLFLLSSPIFIVFAGSNMTEIPMIFFLSAGFTAFLFGLRETKFLIVILGAMLVGFSIGIREQALFFLPLLVLIPFLEKRPPASIACAAVGLLAALFIASLGPLLFLAGDYQGYVDRFRHWSSNVRPNYNITLSTLKPLLFYTFINSPAVILSILGLMGILLYSTKLLNFNRIRLLNSTSINLKPVLVYFFAGGILPLFFLLPDPDLSMHPRYELCAVPGITALAATAVDLLFRRARLWKFLFTVLLCWSVIQVGSREINSYNESQRKKKNLMESLTKVVPNEAVFLAGSFTPIIEYYRNVDLKPQWRTIKSGWDWPKDNLQNVVNLSLVQGKPVYIISDQMAWFNLENEWRDIENLRQYFCFERIARFVEKISRCTKS